MTIYRVVETTIYEIGEDLTAWGTLPKEMFRQHGSTQWEVSDDKGRTWREIVHPGFTPEDVSLPEILSGKLLNTEGNQKKELLPVGATEKNFRKK